MIFTIEVILRLISSNSIKSYFCDSWNVFDLSIVLICFIPESLFENTSTITTLRVLRVFRVLRLLKFDKEIKLIVSVLVKSMKSLFYNFVLFIVFLYLFSIIGVTLFKLPSGDISNQNKSIK